MRPVPEELAISGRRFGVHVDGDDDRLDMVIAPALVDADSSDLGERLDEVRLIFAVIAEVADCGILLYRRRDIRT